MIRNGISVIICCHNSASRIAKTLEHLANQKVDAQLSWEIILVNNASTDDTAGVASSEWQKHASSPVCFQIVEEDKPGLSHAREKGVQCATNDYLIFCDDDNWLQNDYVATAFNIISANPAIAALGGQSAAVADIPLPEWFHAAEANYAVGKQAKESGDVSSRKFLWGSGITIRKQAYLKAYANNPSLLTGRKGQELTAGEDSEMCMRFLLMEYRLYYSDRLVFKHFISKERLTKAYNSALMDGFIKAHQILVHYATAIDISQMSFSNKLILLARSASRLAIMAVTQWKRWNSFTEKANVVLTSGFRFSSLPHEIALIKKMSTLNKA